MQNRYVGDIGDFGKYALLRTICNVPTGQELRLGIVWCLFPDEDHNSDGRYTSYLSRDNWRELDPKLYDVLKLLVESNRRHVSAISNSNIFPKDTHFFEMHSCHSAINGVLPAPADRVSYRAKWIDKCLESTSNRDLIFFDPDNGLEIPSVPKKHPKAGKYIYWDELKLFAERGQSLVIYHHLHRRATVRAQVEDLRALFAMNISAHRHVLPFTFRRGSCRVFWLVLTDRMMPLLRDQLRSFQQSNWRYHFEFSQCDI